MVALPSDEQAIEFCVLLKAGVPAEHAILYFVATEDPQELNQTLAKWLRSRAVSKAQQTLLGKRWQDMSLEEQCNAALEQTYASLAYMLFSTNYTTANAGEKSKLDSARTALEARKAGTAGKIDPLWQFIEDFKRDRVRKMSVVS
jgi:hypothetical protein